MPKRNTPPPVEPFEREDATVINGIAVIAGDAVKVKRPPTSSKSGVHMWGEFRFVSFVRNKEGSTWIEVYGGYGNKKTLSLPVERVVPIKPKRLRKKAD